MYVIVWVRYMLFYILRSGRNPWLAACLCEMGDLYFTERIFYLIDGL